MPAPVPAKMPGPPGEILRDLVRLMLKVIDSIEKATDYSFQMFIGLAFADGR
jgi:hypothetical protein